MTTMQYAGDMYKKSYQISYAYDESTCTNIFIEGVDLSICHSGREYWAIHPQVDVFDIAFMAQSLPAIQGEATTSTTTCSQVASSEEYENRIWNRPAAHAIEAES